jgi:hypothetical protein
MGEQSDKHGPREDESLAQEVRGLVQGGHATHVEEWADPQAPGEDQPEDGRVLSGTRQGLAPGLTEEAVEERSEIARFLGRSAFPGDRDRLLEVAAENQATDEVLTELRRLPAERTFDNVGGVVEALGLPQEEHRT